jgi:hypothetical protein
MWLMKSRFNAAGQGVVQALKTVNIYFNRKRDVDIVPEISPAGGIEFELKSDEIDPEAPDDLGLRLTGSVNRSCTEASELTIIILPSSSCKLESNPRLP